MNFKNVCSKIFSAVFSALIIGQPLCPSASAGGGYTALHERLKNGVNMTVDEVRNIVEANPGCAKQVYRNASGKARSAIDYALNEGINSVDNRVAIAEYLIDECGAPVAPEFNSGKPLFCFDSYWFIRWLWARKCLYGGIDFTARTPDEGRNVLHMLAVRGDLEMFTTISREYSKLAVELDNEGKSVLHLAAIANKYTIVKYILENLQQVDPNGKDIHGSTPLQLAKNCHSDLAESELRKSYRVNDIPVTPAAASASKANTTSASTKKFTAPKSEEEAKNQLIAAIGGLDDANFRRALSSFVSICGNGNPNCYVEDGKTILHLLMENNGLIYVETFFKEYGKSIETNCVSEKEGDTPLIALVRYASKNKSPDIDAFACQIIGLLIEHGADPTRTNKEGKNALNYCLKKFPKIKAKLLSCGCPPAVVVQKESHNPFKALLRKIRS